MWHNLKVCSIPDKEQVWFTIRTKTKNQISKEDNTMSKITKKEKAQAEATAKIEDQKLVEKHSKRATIKTSIPKHITSEQAIVAERIADGDEATTELLKVEAKDKADSEKICPSCNAGNPKGKVTCSNCGEKLYKSSKIASKVASKAEAKSKVKVQKEASVRYARKDSVADAILELKTFTEEELINKADSLFSQNGGNSNLKESKAVASFILPAIVRMGVVTVEGKEFTFKPIV
jgi:ribosomal protein L40E